MKRHSNGLIVMTALAVGLGAVLISQTPVPPGYPSPVPTETGGLSPIPIVSASPSPSPTPTATDVGPPSPSPSPLAGAHEWGPFAAVGLQNRPDPDPALTPGATNPKVTQGNIKSTICVSGYTATIRPPASYTTSLKKKQIIQYKYTDTLTADYEEDHLISLEVGGNPTDPKNLWPEPLTAHLADGTAVGYRVKDRFENWVRAHVCSGSITLAVGQKMLSVDWVAAWMKAGKP